MPNETIRRKRNTNRSRRRVNRTSGDSVGKYASDAWSLAKRTAVGLNEIRKLINIETKFFDVNANITATQAGAVQYLNGIVQGTDLSNRIGDSIRIQHIQFIGAVYVAASSPASIRILVVRDMENGGAAPAGSDIMANAGGAGAAVSQYNFINHIARFSVIFDELVTLDALSNLTAVVKYETSHKGHIRFRDTTAAVTGGAEGSLWFIALTDVAATQPVIRFSCRVTYTDD